MRFVLAVGALLAACGAAVQVPSTAGRPSPAAHTAAPTPSATGATPTPVPTVPPSPSMAPAPPSPSSTSFPIHAVGGSSTGGTVTVTMSGGAAHLHIVVTGLAPGSTHAIHDHLGTCAAAGSSTHLTVLAVATAGMDGVISVSVQVPAFDAGSDRIVIVYATSANAVISGCADL